MHDHALVPVIPLHELNDRFRFVEGKPLVRDSDRRLVHWAGAKPYLTREASFPGPMVYYRLAHLRRRSLWYYVGTVGSRGNWRSDQSFAEQRGGPESFRQSEEPS